MNKDQKKIAKEIFDMVYGWGKYKEQANLIYNTSRFDIKLGNLLANCMKVEKKAEQDFDNIPF